MKEFVGYKCKHGRKKKRPCHLGDGDGARARGQLSLNFEK
jgi:hypothetical protein